MFCTPAATGTFAYCCDWDGEELDCVNNTAGISRVGVGSLSLTCFAVGVDPDARFHLLALVCIFGLEHTLRLCAGTFPGWFDTL